MLCAVHTSMRGASCGMYRVVCRVRSVYMRMAPICCALFDFDIAYARRTRNSQLESGQIAKRVWQRAQTRDSVFRVGGEQTTTTTTVRSAVEPVFRRRAHKNDNGTHLHTHTHMYVRVCATFSPAIHISHLTHVYESMRVGRGDMRMCSLCARARSRSSRILELLRTICAPASRRRAASLNGIPRAVARCCSARRWLVAFCVYALYK